MHGNGADGVVDFKLVQGDDGERHQHTAGDAKEHGLQGRGGVGSGRDRHQAGQGPVEDHSEIGFTKQETRAKQRADQAAGGGAVGVHKHDRNRIGAVDTGGGEHRSPVEAEPAQPENKGAQGGQRQIGAGNHRGGTVGAVFAGTRAEQQHARQGSGGAGQMHDAGAGEVAKTQFAQAVQAEHRLLAPGPTALHRVDKTGHKERESQEGPQLHTFGDGAGHDRHGGGDKHHLKIEVRGGRVGGRLFGAGNAVAGDAREEVIAAVHNGVTADHVHDARDRKQRHVLSENFSGVLGANEASLKHGKPGGHPHHQGAAHKKIKRVQRIAQRKNFVIHKSSCP